MTLTTEQIERINAHQANPRYHPLTCGSGSRTDAQHTDGEGVLVATADGLVCPFCGWRQDAGHPTIQMIAGK